MPGKTVDGNDVIAVAEVADEFIQRARKGEGPALLEMTFDRWRGHLEGDPMGYRSKEEILKYRKKDPVPRFEKVLLKQGLITQEEILKIKQQAEDEAEKAQLLLMKALTLTPNKYFQKFTPPLIPNREENKGR